VLFLLLPFELKKYKKSNKNKRKLVSKKERKNRGERQERERERSKLSVFVVLFWLAACVSGVRLLLLLTSILFEDPPIQLLCLGTLFDTHNIFCFVLLFSLATLF
jgi:hypothetical protein